ncbi:MAG: type II toxin-antitoxin system RelE/ParE family toxin [Bacteroidales bacterium]|nr:type II toxin-antitoxin system RelE/ParE family toxin [Bacteroidales bacterium]
MVKIVWTKNAIQDLGDIGDYIAKDSVRYAEVTVTRLFTAVDILEQYPKAGKVVIDFNEENIRELIRGAYRIVYKIVNTSRIDILTVHHTSRLLRDLINLSD